MPGFRRPAIAPQRLDELRQVARLRGWNVVTEHVNDGVSGATTSRPALDHCPTCSAMQGGQLCAFSRKTKTIVGVGMKTRKEVNEIRASLAVKYGFDRCAAPEDATVGIARNIRSGQVPINGVRCLPENGTTGWYIWAGETTSDDPDYFVPLHVSHLDEWCPYVLPYLEVPPGWRFLIAPGQEDVWFDPEVDLSPTTEG